MDNRPPIERVREREFAGEEPFKSDRETYSEKQAKLDREAPTEQPTQEDPETFRERMEDALKESGTDASPDP